VLTLAVGVAVYLALLAAVVASVVVGGWLYLCIKFWRYRE